MDESELAGKTELTTYELQGDLKPASESQLSGEPKLKDESNSNDESESIQNNW